MPATASLPQPHPSLLATIPGDPGLPLIGNTLKVMHDPTSFLLRLYETHGPVARSRFFGLNTVALIGAEANQLVLRNQDHVFSNALGWEYFIKNFFKRGLMLLDAEEHRFHRGIMQAAFKKPRLVEYLERMNPVIARGLKAWQPQSRFSVYPSLKQLTLDIATEVFMGERLGPEADSINKAFVDAVRAGSSVVRYPVPGLRWHKGLAGRKLLEDFFRERLPARRANPGADLLSRLCQAEDEQGAQFADEDVINHMIFLMMAAHDTTTITLSSMIYFLARHPEWQDKLREESLSLGKHWLDHEDLATRELADRVMKESLRMIAPVHVLPRRTLREVTIEGLTIPPGTPVIISPQATHMMSEWWRYPRRFDPDRFSAERAEHKRHAYQFVPFGGGGHMCIGLHFGEMEIQAILHQLLQQFRWCVPAGYEMPVNYTSLPSPGDQLPVQWERL